MSSADLFEDGFPHGTARGYELGCRGSACPAKVEFGQSCREANIRVASDWGYRKRVQAGAPVEEQRLPEVAAAPVVKVPRPARPVEHRLQEAASARRDHDVPRPTARPKPAPPTPIAPELQQWREETAPQQEGARSSSMAKSRGAFASRSKQRDHALATASEEHPMGLTLNGEPRRRCAPGTVLVAGVLRRAEEVTEAEIAAASAATAIRADAPEAVTEPEPEAAVHVEDEEPRPRGKRVLDDAVRTLAESLELQRALAGIGERALRTIRIEINHMRREVAALENQHEK